MVAMANAGYQPFEKLRERCSPLRALSSPAPRLVPVDGLVPRPDEVMTSGPVTSRTGWAALS